MSLSTDFELEIGSLALAKPLVREASRREEKLSLGDIVCHVDPFHVRGASRGVVESIKLDESDERRAGETRGFRVWWESDGENQITGAFRTYEEFELKLVEE